MIDAPVPEGSTCEPLRRPTDVSLQKGDEVGVAVAPQPDEEVGFFNAQYAVRLLEDGTPVPGRLGVHPNVGRLLRAELDDLDVQFVPAPGSSLVLCR